MPKARSLSPHLTSVHKSSAFSIGELELGNQCSNLRHPDTNSCLILLLLTFMNLAFLMMCYDSLFVKPAFRLRIVRAMCDVCPFASWRVEASFFRGFPVYTHSPVARTISLVYIHCAYFAQSYACHTHAWLKGVCSAHVVISLSSHLLFSHVSPVLAPAVP